jgi:Pregnancy-associated plasma protein-A/Secretion system C-terminal sorting domain
MKRNLLNLLVLLLLINTMNAQTSKKCGTLKAYDRAIAKDPSIIAKKKLLEIATQNATASQNKETRATVYTIPVVIHVIHNGEAIGTGTNISDAQILSQLEILNKDFRLKNADSLIPNHPFYGVIADCKIEFCLAKQDELGNATTGITRKNGMQPSWEIQDVDDIIKPSTIWDRHKYLNLWSINFGGVDSSLLGYATFPSSTSDTTDGVAIRPQAFGNIGTAGTGNFATNNLGRTGSHEVGHWLNLTHIWGDSTCGDDFVTDTEIAEQSNFDCPTFPHKPNSNCGSGANGEMYMNFMDYVDDGCMNMFTAGQRDRMKVALTIERTSLITSNGCSSLTGVSDITIINDLTLFPNPTTNVIHISSNANDITNIEIYTISGVRIFDNFTIKKSNKSNIIIDVNNLQSGNYVLKIKSNQQVSTHKISIIK